MSVLTAEYDPDVAKRVYGDERAEDRAEEIALNMLQDGDPIEKITRNTGLSEKAILQLKKRMAY